MNLCFALLQISICLLYSTVLHATHNDEHILYGVCCQFNNTNENSREIVLSSENLNIDFETNYAFNISNGPINCIWFDSNANAQSASNVNIEIFQKSFNQNNENLQESTQNQPSEVICDNHKIHIHTSKIGSKHLCSESCPIDNHHPCFTVASERSIPDRYYGQSDVKPLVPSMFGISGICIAFIVVCVIIYCFGVKYSRWTQEKNGNEAERAIDDVLDEIAKYTIGDDEEEGLYGDWDEYADSDSSDSTHSNEEALGQTILRVVSTQSIPEVEALNPSIYSSDSDTESDEESRREDLLVAKETLYAVSYGTNNPYSNNLATINEKVIERKVSINNGTPKKIALLSGGEMMSPYKLSSDASNSALP